jgi:hypothetical protein
LGISVISVTPGLRLWRLYEALAMAQGTVWSFSPLMNSRGPRSGFFVSTFASVAGLTFAFAICISATPGAATWYVSYRCRASSSSSAFAHPYLNWSNVSVTARPRLSGLESTGSAERRVEIGSGKTPRNGPGSIATVAAERPRSAMIWASKPPVEWPITAGLRSSLAITASVWAATRPSVTRANACGLARASSIDSGSPGHETETGA